MAEARGQKRGPCANVGCPDPDNRSGQWNWLHSVRDLDGLDLREDAVCWCNKRGCRAYIKKTKEEEREKLKEAMFRGSANDPCLPNAYKVKLIREIWGVRCTAARNVDESASHAPHSPLHTPCGRYVNLGKMSPKRRGAELDTYHCEYIVYGDFERDAPYSFNTTAYWVTLSKMVKDVKRQKTEAEIEIFEGNLEMIRKGEIEELPSDIESEGEEDEGEEEEL